MTAERPTDADEIDPDRSVFLTDGVIAIAMTLLALDLKPDLPTGASSRELAHYLGEHGNQYASFAIAFAVIAQYWITHHRIMRTVRRATPGLIGTNLVFLFGITLIPLTTYLQGNYTGSLSVTLFAANLMLISVCLAIIRAVVARRGLDDRRESAARRERITRGVQIIVIPGLVAGLAWVLGGHASWFFLLFFLPDDVLTRRRRRSTDGIASPGE